MEYPDPHCEINEEKLMKKVKYKKEQNRKLLD